MDATENVNVHLPPSASEVISGTARYRKRHTIQNIIILLLLMTKVGSLSTLAATVGLGNGNEPVCRSEQCIKFADGLTMAMDRSVDPCDNFYKFVCGNINDELNSSILRNKSSNWFVYSGLIVADHLQKKLRSNVTQYPRPVRQLKALFDLCFDADKVETKTVISLLRSLSLPPYPSIVRSLSGHLDPSTYTFDWLDTIIKVKTQLGIDILMSLMILPDPQNSTLSVISMKATPASVQIFPSIENVKQRNIRDISQSSDFFKIFATDMNVDNGTTEKEKHMANDYKYLKLIKSYSDIKLNESDYLLISKKFQDFKNKIKEVIPDVTENDTCIEFANENKYKINEIQSHTDEYVESNNGTAQPIWKRYLEGVFNVSDVELDFEQDKILMSTSDMTYMDKIALLVSKTDPIVLELYIWLEVVNQLADNPDYSDDDWVRSILCAVTGTKIFEMAALYALIDDLFYPDSLIQKALIMVDEIKHAFEKTVANIPWMDFETKQSTYEKLRKMSPFIGIPEWLFEPGKLEEYSNGIEVNQDITYLENMVKIRLAQLKKGLNIYHHQDSLSWAGNPTETNAYYFPMKNTITVNFPMLLYPFFDLGLNSLNYGALGTVIGHEITHGFDSCGRFYDMNGNVVQWWSNNSIEHFVNKTNCFIDQYSSYNASEINTEVNQNINGRRTLGENIADNGGLRLSLAALQQHLLQHGPDQELPEFEGMTSEQMFFLSYAHTWCHTKTTAKEELQARLADVHSPNMFRVIGTLQNSEEFAKAWNCPVGSPMNPGTERCVIY